MQKSEKEAAERELHACSSHGLHTRRSDTSGAWEETPSKHIFSKHDNRHAFPGSATYFESGLGRRRIEGSLPNTHHLIDWFPLKDELQRERPLMSSYQSDFRTANKVPQLLIHHGHLQEKPLQRTPSTTYQRTYRSYYLGEPTMRLLHQHQLGAAKEPETKQEDSSAAPTSAEPMAGSGETAAANASLAPGPLYRRSASSKQRWTVSDCLHWYNC